MERQGRLRRRWIFKPIGTGTDAQGVMLFWDDTLQAYVPTDVDELIWDDTAKILKPIALTVGGTSNYTKIDLSGNFKHFGTSKFLNLTWDIETFTSDDTLDAENVVILLDGSSNSVTASLPTAVGIVGRVYYIKSIDTTNFTDVNPNGSETIDGGSANLILAKDASITIISDNSNWWII